MTERYMLKHNFEGMIDNKSACKKKGIQKKITGYSLARSGL